MPFSLKWRNQAYRCGYSMPADSVNTGRCSVLLQTTHSSSCGQRHPYVPFLATPFASSSITAHSWSPPPITFFSLSFNGSRRILLITPRAFCLQSSVHRTVSVSIRADDITLLNIFSDLPRLVKWPAAGCVPSHRHLSAYYSKDSVL